MTIYLTKKIRLFLNKSCLRVCVNVKDTNMFNVREYSWNPIKEIKHRIYMSHHKWAMSRMDIIKNNIIRDFVAEVTTPTCTINGITKTCTDKITYDCIIYRAEKYLGIEEHSLFSKKYHKSIHKI